MNELAKHSHLLHADTLKTEYAVAQHRNEAGLAVSSVHMDTVRLQAPAKINLVLRVGPPDGTGFHALASWMCTAGLFDTLTFTRTSKPGIILVCDDKSLPTDSSNLVVRAAHRLIDRAASESSRRLGVRITLQKRIPAAAGLGGGSSDAAATLHGINRLLEHPLPRARLAEEAPALGSDVPFFFAAPSAWCTGRGEKTSPVPAPRRAGWVVIARPPFGLTTADVYRRFDEMGLGRTEDLQTPADLMDWPALPASELMCRLVNDLEAPAFDLRPELGRLRAEMEQKIGRPVRMSGSGSTLFSLFDAELEARQACAAAHQGLAIQATAVQLAPPAGE